MKKNYIIYIISSYFLSLFLTSCSDYLDNDPEDLLTIEQVFQNKQFTEEYLANVYSYIKDENKWTEASPWTGISDELDVTYPDARTSNMNLGALTPDKDWYFFWHHYYKGIRSASIFINNVDKNPILTSAEKAQYKAEARFLRTWFYFNLVRQYGPVIILGDNIVSEEASIEEMSYSRSPISACFAFIESELNATIAMEALPLILPKDGRDYGRVTAGACKALKSRALLYAASDLYNKDANGAFYNDFANLDGAILLDYTNADSKERWKKAAEAAKAVIDHGYSLYIVKKDGVIDPFASYQQLFIKDWNEEVIWAKPSGSFWEMDNAANPRVLNAWGGWAPTQKMVDAYFSKNGLPVVNSAAFPIAKDPTYTEVGFTTDNGDHGHTQANTYNMYTNREPRFYLSIFFSNSKTIASRLGDNQRTMEFFYGGNSGKTAQETRNFPQTGYLCRKFVHPESYPVDGKFQEHAQIMFRLGEFYLNYAEALNEVDFASNRGTVLTYINAIRERAGIPGYGEASVPMPATQGEMREIIRRERQVELAFESHRYFDCGRWNIADKEFGGEFEGMNVNAVESQYYRRTVFETRTFEQKNILYPIYLNEMFKGENLVQNPGW